ncbi:MAG: LemA family protein [Actinomycetota bacterium]|nr:LemA family protein [Actinomycetota bacterium]
MAVIIIVILVVIVLAILFFVLAYNAAVRLRNRVDSAWSQISVQLQRRHDLIPNLIETVKGYAGHERQTLEAVTAARTGAVQAQQAGPAQQAQAENVLSGALRQLFALSESYPDLKANQNFLSLQEELTSTEDRIAYSRQFYNDSVQKYNTKIQTFPTMIVAGMFNFSPREFFEAEEGSTEVPKVQF